MTVLLKFLKRSPSSPLVRKDIIVQIVSINLIVSISIRAPIYLHSSFVNGAQKESGFVCLCLLYSLEIFSTALRGRGGNPR